MCIKSTEKLNEILEKSQHHEDLRKLLEEITRCNTCYYLDNSKAGMKQSCCTLYHRTEFRNRLFHIFEDMEI